MGLGCVKSGSGRTPACLRRARRRTQGGFLISLQTFGGLAGQIAMMQRVLVGQTRWIGQRRFLHSLNYCMLLPGPEAPAAGHLHRLAAGWYHRGEGQHGDTSFAGLNGVRGGLIAGTLFVLPGLLVMIGLSALYLAFGDTSLVNGLLFGLAPAARAWIEP